MFSHRIWNSAIVYRIFLRLYPVCARLGGNQWVIESCAHAQLLWWFASAQVIDGRKDFYFQLTFRYRIVCLHYETTPRGTNWVGHESAESRSRRQISVFASQLSNHRYAQWLASSSCAIIWRGLDKLLIDSTRELSFFNWRQNNNSISLIKKIFSCPQCLVEKLRELTHAWRQSLSIRNGHERADKSFSLWAKRSSSPFFAQTCENFSFSSDAMPLSEENVFTSHGLTTGKHVKRYFYRLLSSREKTENGR